MRGRSAPAGRPHFLPLAFASMPSVNRKSVAVLLMSVLALFPFASIRGMQSDSYRIDQDSINFGGTEDSASASYRLSDTLGEVATGESGAPCGAVSFDGADDYAKVSNSAALNLSGDYSIALWVYNRAGSKSYPTLLNRESQSGTNGFFWIYSGGTDENTINYQYANGSAYGTVSFSSVLGLNEWNHLVFTFVGATKTLTLYVDGQDLGATRTLTGALPVDGGDLYLGSYQGQTSNYPFYGYLDDVRLYGRTLSAGEAADLFAGKQLDSAGLLGQWGFDEGTGTSVADRSGHDNAATLTGAVFSTNVPASTCQTLSAGYRQLTMDSYIGITNPAGVDMLPVIGGVTGGTGNGSTSWKVTTDNPAGFEVSVRATTAPALTVGGSSFADYVPAGSAPDFAWSVASTDSEFGYTIEGADAVSRFLDNGNTCAQGLGNTPDSCWAPFSLSDQSVVSAGSPNHPLGTETTIKFRAESGSQHIQPNGTYTATIIVTAVSL